jgi:hypothetical protein
MWRGRAKFAKTALALALLLAVGPAREHLSKPLNDIRTALELVNKEPSRALKSASLVRSGRVA